MRKKEEKMCEIFDVSATQTYSIFHSVPMFTLLLSVCVLMEIPSLDIMAFLQQNEAFK